MGAVIFLHIFPRVFIMLVQGVVWLPHRQGDFQIQTLEGTPVLTSGLFKAGARLHPLHT